MLVCVCVCVCARARVLANRSLFVANGEVLPFFETVRNLAPCEPFEAAGDTTCFFAEVRMSGSDTIWERVVLKEAPPPVWRRVKLSAKRY